MVELESGRKRMAREFPRKTVGIDVPSVIPELTVAVMNPMCEPQPALVWSGSRDVRPEAFDSCHFSSTLSCFATMQRRSFRWRVTAAIAPALPAASAGRTPQAYSVSMSTCALA